MRKLKYTNRDERFREYVSEIERLTQSDYSEGFLERVKSVYDDAEANTVTDKLTGLTLLTGYDYGQLYDWDLYFECIFSAYAGEYRYCRNNLTAFFARQEESGFIKRSFGPYNYGASHPFKPFIAQIMLLYYNGTGDIQFVRENFVRIEKWLDYYYLSYDRDGNGLCCWVNADASGMDNQNSRVLPDGNGEGVDLNCYLYREHSAMAELAKALGDEYSEKVMYFEEKAELIAQRINGLLWDEEDGFYYDRNEATGELVKERGISGLMPLWCGIVPRERAESLISYLENPDEFMTEYPIATLSRASRSYDCGGSQPPSGYCNWNGTTWIVTNYMIFHGLLDYGYDKLAKMIAEKTFELVYVKNDKTREYYNGETGEGYGRNPFYGWSSLGYLMVYEYYMEENPTAKNSKPAALFSF